MTRPAPPTQPTPAGAAPGTAASPHLPALQALASREPAIAAALALVGPPPARNKPLTFGNLCRLILGQRLSVRAAATIDGRMHALPGGVATPAALRDQPIEVLRDVGRRLALAERPDVATVQAAGERWRPHRSAVAMVRCTSTPTPPSERTIQVATPGCWQPSPPA